MKNVSADLLTLINGTITGTASVSTSSVNYTAEDGVSVYTTEDGTAPYYTMVSGGLIAIPISFQDFDCYTLTLASGVILRLTNADFDISDGSGHVWTSATRVDEAGSKTLAHWKVGFDADQWTLIVMPRTVDPVTGNPFPDKIGAVPWIQAAQGGALDAADFQIDRAVFATMPTWPMPPGGAVPVGFINGIFAGAVGAVDTTSTQVIITVQDYRQLLQIQMPRHLWQGQCRHTLFDIGCTANFTTLPRASFATNGIAIGGSTPMSIENNLHVPGGSGTYVQGTIVMTSGLNTGFSRTITGWAGAGRAFKLLIQFPFAIVSGDSFVAYPGCAKTQAACALFNNSANYGGEAYVPTPETAA